MKINKLNIDTSDMPAARTSRQFTVTGNKGAEFELVVLQNPSSPSTHTLYYDFADSAFESGHSDLHNNLKVKLSGSNYVDRIIFPEGGGDYVIKLIALGNTEIGNSTSSVITKNITKATTNTTITFTPGTSSANADNYITLPKLTSIGTTSSTDTKSFSWKVENSNEDDRSFGFRLLLDDETISDRFWYFQKVEDVADNTLGDGEDNTEVTVASTTDLTVGMELIYHKAAIVPTNKAGSPVGTTRITAISTETDSSGNYTLTVSPAVAFEDGETMTFRAYGASTINEAIGLGLEFSQTNFSGVELTSTLRDDSDGDLTTSTTVRLGATGGISGGNVVTYTGEGVNNERTNTVDEITQADGTGDDRDGAMTVTLTQILREGTVLTFNGSHKIVEFGGQINITKYPSSDRTIYLDLEKIITLGVSGA